MPFRGRYVHLRLREPNGIVQSVPYFISEGVPDPSIASARNEELW